MSNSKMLIDAAHPEETRVVVLKGNRVEEFDFESASKKQLRGNIYLAKVTRVEPSLQAAFVEYGGNRHGFLAFSEIHPDYYQIPFADRQALLEEEARAHRDEEDDGGRGGAGGGESRSRDNRRGSGEGGERSARGEGRAEGRGEGRGERNGRGGERGQRRSRRHRRDQTTALDRRGAVDERISESADEISDQGDTTLIQAVDGDDAGENAVATEARDHMEVAGAAGEDLAQEASSEHADDLRTGAATALALVEADAPDAPVERTTAEPEPDAEAPAAAPSTATSSEVQALPAAPDAVSAPSATIAADDAEPVLAGDAEMSGPDDATPSAGEVQARDLSDQDRSDERRSGVGDVDEDRAADDHAGADDRPAQHDADPIEARDTQEHPDDDGAASEHEEEHVEQIGGDALSDVAPRPTRLRRHYKIQEVIKRRQILLIQVVKEERGNKGAALTTYLSLAGRYSVLMPNTAKGGGISRKITDGEDRKRLKAIAGELDVPEGMGVILRTAGASRSPIEVKRDFEYLLRMWESVRELTLKSSAPSLVYEEGSLIKRSIRDLYSKEVEEIVVSGEAGFAEARDFMRMLMPGNVKSVQSYRDPQPIFAKSGVEAQLDAMFSPHVTLKSGGYLVINQTEALVAIDVNSGRSTREHNIEDTALRTNLEAADEVARQLRLRDLAGLIVVDFIDMEEGRNNRAVERRIKEALKNDRARIQIGRISHFGLLEMSRQRIRTGVLEGSTVVCPHCAGAGTVRSTASIALHVLRLVEDALLKDASHDLVVHSRAEVALYMLNQKRAKLVELEQRFGVCITVTADPALTGMVYHTIERGELAAPSVAPAPRQDLVRVDSIAPIYEPGSEFEEVGETAEPTDEAEADMGEDALEAGATEAGDSEGRRRKRRRRRRGRDRDTVPGEARADAAEGSDDAVATQVELDLPAAAETEAVDTGSELTAAESEPGAIADAEVPVTASVPLETAPAAAEAGASEPSALPEATIATVDPEPEPAVEEAPKRRRSRRTAARIAEEAEGAAAPASEAAPADEEAPARPRRRRPSRARAAEANADAAAPAAAAAAGAPPPAAPDAAVSAEVAEAERAPPSAEAALATADAPTPPATSSEAGEQADAADLDPDRPKRSGWWQRAKASFGS